MIPHQDGCSHVRKVSVIIPALNEAEEIRSTLNALQLLRSAGHEIILVDGGSTDQTVALSAPLADRVIVSTVRGRACQMNAGAYQATGDILLFLHADTRLPLNAITAVLSEMANSSKAWGRFNVRLTGRNLMLRIVERMINWRSRLTGIATGDQAIFVRKDIFDAIGGFPEIPLMEDIAFCRRLKQAYSSPLCLSEKVITSSRRWEENGIMRTILLMWWLRFAYFMGTPPGLLAQYYRHGETKNE